MKKILRYLAAIALAAGVGLPAFVSAQTGSIDTTGPDSSNTAKFDNDTKTDVKNNNNVDVSSKANQEAKSGDTKVNHNTTGGGAMSGDADNSHSVSADLSVDNSSASMPAAHAAAMTGNDSSATISNTGPDSTNKVTVDNKMTTTVTNNNTVKLMNDVKQNATSGKAEVSGNTTGGNATSGSVSNTSTSDFTISLTN